MTRHSFIDFHRGYTIQIVSCDNNFQLEISTLQHRGRECQQLPPVIYTCCKFKLLQFCLAFISPYFSQVRTDQQLEVSEASGVVFGGSGCFFVVCCGTESVQSLMDCLNYQGTQRSSAVLWTVQISTPTIHMLTHTRIYIIQISKSNLIVSFLAGNVYLFLLERFTSSLYGKTAISFCKKLKN